MAAKFFELHSVVWQNVKKRSAKFRPRNPGPMAAASFCGRSVAKAIKDIALKK